MTSGEDDDENATPNSSELQDNNSIARHDAPKPIAPSSPAPKVAPGEDDDEDDSDFSDTSDDSDGEEPSQSQDAGATKTKKQRYTPGRRRGRTVRRYSPAYVRLLNRLIRATKLRQIHPPTFLPHHGSHVLGSYWTPLEKEIFFNMLALKGKDRVDLIAAAIPTKSPVEVSAYLQLLDEADRNSGSLGIRNRGRDFVGMKDIPAAVELSEETVQGLEECADAVEKEVTRQFERKERARWGEQFWQFDATAAAHISSLAAEGDWETIEEIAPEAELLDVETMLDLSRLLFMNGPDEANFRAHSDTPPTLLYEALVDFHTLVKSVTRRIVAATIFRTEQRLHTDRSYAHTPSRTVTVSDVRRTLKALKLPLNRLSFFTTLPRRNGLRVVKLKLAMNYRDPATMSYRDVEAHLSAIDKKQIPRYFARDFRALVSAQQEADRLAARARSPSPPPAPDLNHPNPDDNTDDDDDDELLELTTHHPGLPLKTLQRRLTACRRHALLEHTHLTALDALRSAHADRLLTQHLLSRTPARTPLPPLPAPPAALARLRRLPINWRRTTARVPGWWMESKLRARQAGPPPARDAETPVFDEAAALEQRRKRAREEVEAATTAAGERPPKRPRAGGEPRKERYRCAAQRRREAERELRRLREEHARAREEARRLGRARARLGRVRQMEREKRGVGGLEGIGEEGGGDAEGEGLADVEMGEAGDTDVEE